MTNSSSKPLQTLGKWYQPRNPKKIPKPAQKKILKLFHTQKEMLKQDLEQPAGWFCIVLPQTSSKSLSWIAPEISGSLQMAFWEKNTLVIERCGPQGRFREERCIDDQGILIFKLTGLEAAVGGSIFGMG
jgi:hypothetical protein